MTDRISVPQPVHRFTFSNDKLQIVLRDFAAQWENCQDNPPDRDKVKFMAAYLDALSRHFEFTAKRLAEVYEFELVRE